MAAKSVSGELTSDSKVWKKKKNNWDKVLVMMMICFGITIGRYPSGNGLIWNLRAGKTMHYHVPSHRL